MIEDVLKCRKDLDEAKAEYGDTEASQDVAHWKTSAAQERVDKSYQSYELQIDSLYVQARRAGLSDPQAQHIIASSLGFESIATRPYGSINFRDMPRPDFPGAMFELYSARSRQAPEAPDVQLEQSRVSRFFWRYGGAVAFATSLVLVGVLAFTPDNNYQEPVRQSYTLGSIGSPDDESEDPSDYEAHVDLDERMRALRIYCGYQTDPACEQGCDFAESFWEMDESCSSLTADIRQEYRYADVAVPEEPSPEIDYEQEKEFYQQMGTVLLSAIMRLNGR
jgi:hypothetical protein